MNSNNHNDNSTKNINKQKKNYNFRKLLYMLNKIYFMYLLHQTYASITENFKKKSRMFDFSHASNMLSTRSER